ncbi:response regulator [Cohnella cholangitidis]|uniref:Response regulator n=1 Tax=Cohnella cholangitidis TaxID=2598458 RepID=A0A7G5BUJ6_9BACL|nr:response regulator [Cohnella cholangitidis]QMV40630.1 response regulator [Cohnella cholangitidis]
MYNILIVDDEPLICRGLANLLQSSGLNIQNIYTASNGYEALDYLKMETIDLLVTDIQMGAMSGIELMQQAKIIKPWVQVIVISAHETFQYAQLAMRLGARDYLIKPINSEQLLNSVRHVLLHMDRPVQDQAELFSNLREHFRMEQPHPQRTELLNRILAESLMGSSQDTVDLEQQNQISLRGPYFAMIKIRLDFNSSAKGAIIEEKDARLLQYAVLNIVNELLDKEWDHYSFYSSNQDVSMIIQWDEARYGESSVDKINQLEMIGRSLHFNVHKFLGFQCVVGISQILKGREFLSELNDQVNKAIVWNREHKDHHVFYYGDFKWERLAEDPTDEELAAQNNLIVERAHEYIHANYAQKGLTLNEVAQKNHVSPNYLSYLFKKNKGINLWEYVIKLRMEESKRLIQHTDLRRYEISERVGYESPEHFSKIFKKYFGMSPSEMKK